MNGEEDDISDAIYGDLGDFEFEEKFKEQNQEIASLTDRLNQSVVTITDLQIEIKNLKKENRQLKKNTSSLLLTAKVELNRKQRDITLLQQKIDNRIFRRKNNLSIGVQTDPQQTFAPLVQCNDSNNGNVFAQMNSQQLTGERCTQESSDNVDQTKNPHSDINKFRIPKKYPIVRHDNSNESRNQIDACNDKKMEDSHHLPRKNPFSRCAGDDEKSKEILVSRFCRNEIEGENTRPTDRRDSRRHSPNTHASSRHRDYRKSRSHSKSDDQKRHSRRNDRRGRSSSDETDRHSKRYRCDSSTSHHQSRTKTSRNEEKCSQTMAPKRSNSKPRKFDRIDEVKSKNGSDLKEKDLEAMLIAQKKILDELGPDKNSSKERRRRKNSIDEKTAEKLVNSNRDDSKDQIRSINGKSIRSDLVNSTNDGTATVAAVSESENFIEEVTTNAVDYVEVLSEELPSIEAATTTTDSKPLSPFREHFSPAKGPSESTDTNVDSTIDTKVLPKTSQFQNNENSNSQMDIDYELMERTSSENQTNFSSEEKNRQLWVENSSIANDDDVIRQSPPTLVNASFIAVENNVAEVEESVGENNLDSSHERHILTKSSEYTVQDVGHEIRIFLTKKRKKNKNANVAAT